MDTCSTYAQMLFKPYKVCPCTCTCLQQLKIVCTCATYNNNNMCAGTMYNHQRTTNNKMRVDRRAPPPLFYFLYLERGSHPVQAPASWLP